MTVTEKRERRSVLRLSGRGYASLILFLALSLIFEVTLIFAFQMMGLSDQNAWTTTWLIPGTNFSFTATISPLLHLLPINVIIVLFTSWMYLTKSPVFLPRRETTKRIPLRRAIETGRFKSTQRFFRNISRRLRRFGRGVQSGIAKIPGATSISQRLSSARSAVRSAIMILLVFIALTVGLIFVEYPDLIYHLTVNLYQGYPGLVDFAYGIGSWLRGVGTVLPPLGDFGGSINNAFVAVAPGFRESLEAAGASLTQPIFQLDIVGKFALSQNLAAWIVAILALLYGTYASARRRQVRSR